MGRLNIFEILDQEYDIQTEMIKINELFNQRLIRHVSGLTFQSGDFTIEEFVDEFLLIYWKQRKNFLSCKEMLTKITSVISSIESPAHVDLLLIIEYYINLINLIDLKTNSQNISNQFYREYYMLKENIDILIEHLNYEKLTIVEDEKILLVPKNPAATAVAEISTKEMALTILRYNHSSLKGNLAEKRKVLYQMSLEYEPLLKTPIEGYKDFYEKTNGLLNTLHIRHNNTTKENNKNNVIDIRDEELEKWYDELYQLLLFCVLIKDNLERKKEVDEFLKEIKKVD